MILYACCSLNGYTINNMIIYFILNFLIEFLGCFRVVIIDSFVAELNNLQKNQRLQKQIIQQKEKTKLMINAFGNSSNQTFNSNSSLSFWRSGGSTIKNNSGLMNISNQSQLMGKRNDMSSFNSISSSIQIERFSKENSIKSAQILEKKQYKESDANLNTSILFGTKLVGKIISNALVGLGYHYLYHFFFIFFAGIYAIFIVYLSCCISNNSSIRHSKKEREKKRQSIITKSLTEIKELNELEIINGNESGVDVQVASTNREVIWKEIKNIFVLIKQKKMLKLLLANAIFKISPSYRSSFDFFLLHILLFTNKEFSIQKILDNVFFFLGIVLLNTLFRKTDNSKFLKANAISYSALVFVLSWLVYFVYKLPQTDFFTIILIYSSLHSLFFEMLFIPIVGNVLILKEFSWKYALLEKKHFS